MIAADDYQAMILDIGMLTGELSRAELFDALVESVKARRLNPQYVVLLRDRLNAVLDAADYPPPEPLT